MQFEDDPFAKNARSTSKTYQILLLILNFLQTKPHVKSMNLNNYDLYNTVIKNLSDKKDEEKYEISDEFLQVSYPICN